MQVATEHTQVTTEQDPSTTVAADAVAIDTAAIPQQDDLGKVRALVAAMRDGVPRAELGAKVGLSGRHVRYTFHAARALGLTTQDGLDWAVTPRVDQLLAVDESSDAEAEVLRSMIRTSETLTAVAPELLTDRTLNLEDLAGRLIALAGFSASTAVRRAMTLLCWRDALLPAEEAVAKTSPTMPQPTMPQPTMPQPTIEEDDEEEVEELVLVPEPGFEREFEQRPVDHEGQILMF